ncbi:MAG: hypothetical protein DWI57_09065 [Chloroflexi bacterium]|nr:MAG: hypothetical protein DWI57_09065 [Chloroflexota bacterium]
MNVTSVMKMMGMGRYFWMVRCIIPSTNHFVRWCELIVGVLAQHTINPYFVQMQIGAIHQLNNCFHLLEFITQTMFILEGG